MSLSGVELNESRFVSLLEKLISVSKYLQNSPSQGLVPREDLASDFVLELLEPYSTKNGGVLEIERVTFVEGRGNVIIKYPGTKEGRVCSFIGSHLDVVPADPSGWDRDPFKLEVEGDMLYGRGTTDCLGHVAMLTDLMATLAEKKPVLETSVVVVFIANEENSAFVGIGVDQLAKEGYLDLLKSGPVFWIDAADSQPCIGTAGNLQWKIKAQGKLFHSGLPHKGMNAIEMAMDALSCMQARFLTEFPKHPMEDAYNFATQSTFKPTQISCTPGALNQLPPECTIEGDVRLAPFYDVKAVSAFLKKCAADINADLSSIENPAVRGPHSKYTLPLENKSGRVEFTCSEGENGVACSLDSPGHKAINAATLAVLGEAKPYSIGGSLPLICELKHQGFDVQIAGYGFSSRYHADNECVSLSMMKQACQIISRVVSILEG